MFCLTISASRSQIYERAVQASFSILNDYHSIRTAAGYHTPFAMRVLDTRTLFCGQTITAMEAVRLRQAGAQPADIRARLEQLIDNTHTYVISQDLHHLRNRGRARGDRSVGYLGAMLGTALDVKPTVYCNAGHTYPVAKLRGFPAASSHLFEHVIRDIRAGLLVDRVALSFAGQLDTLRSLPGYPALRQACEEQGVELLEMVMSLTGVVNPGKGALSIGYAREGDAALH